MTRKPAQNQTLTRHAAPSIDVRRVRGLSDDHPAVVEGRTLFPTTVVEPMQSPRILVSGHNNPKLGAEVCKGPGTGWPIYHVTLEERATCPRSCAVWAGCYGNAMHLARRHRVSDDLIPVLRAEVLTVARQHPKGLLVRLHTLGDFYSVAYVQMWADLLDLLPQLHCFGFTARSETADDAESRRIATAVRWLTEQAWDQFAIRFSRAEPVPQGSVVLDAPSQDPRVIMCPAQTEATQACATCGLCWSATARERTIGFLRHGIKARGDGARAVQAEIRRHGTETAITPALERLAAAGDRIAIKALARKQKRIGSTAWWKDRGHG